MSVSAVAVLEAIRAGYEYGFDIIDRTGLPSGAVYPVLGRLERDGLVRSAWEDERRAHAQGRPARRYYRLTAPGVAALDRAVRYYHSLLPTRGAAMPRRTR
jgi:DNA-binding PadR family transcriptional regulator